MTLLLLPLLSLALAAPLQAPGADPTRAPGTVVAPDGRSVTDGVRTLAVSQAADLDPDGATLTVTGSGYDETKGVYVAFCVVPAPDQTPSPCGGGVTMTGGTGASQWFSSHPPSYGAGLAVPYGPGGTFTTTLTVAAAIGGGIDCRAVACAVVTRNDHTRGSDRSQDLLVPVTFAGGTVTVPSAGPGAPATAPTPSTTATTATTATTTTVVADGGRTTSDGTRRLSVDAVTGLDPDGTELAVEGEGYDTTRGIYVAFCALPEPGAVPGPCSTGSVGTSAWIADDPPDYGRDLATPYGDGGSFSTTIEVTAVIDAETDCREVRCGIVTRNDDRSPDDRSQDLYVPVSFEGGGAAAAGTGPVATGGTGGDVPWTLLAGAVVVAVAATAPVAVRRRERRPEVAR